MIHRSGVLTLSQLTLIIIEGECRMESAKAVVPKTTRSRPQATGNPLPKEGGEMNFIRRRSGISFLEIMVVLAIMGILALTLSPAILNVLKNRNLEGSARGIIMELNRAKNLAIKNKVQVRVHFAQETGKPWTYGLERQAADGTWEAWPGSTLRTIPGDLQVAVNLPTPGQSVEFSPLGYVEGYVATQNSITLSSEALKTLNQPDVRNLLIFAGGSIQYLKSST